jgi:hypothetical protein
MCTFKFFFQLCYNLIILTSNVLRFFGLHTCTLNSTINDEICKIIDMFFLIKYDMKKQRYVSVF